MVGSGITFWASFAVGRGKGTHVMPEPNIMYPSPNEISIFENYPILMISAGHGIFFFMRIGLKN